MPFVPRRRGDREPPPLPRRPYRDSAILYGVMGVALLVLAWLTGGDVSRAVTVAVAFFVVATLWSWWRLRERARAHERRTAASTDERRKEDGR